jgi:hypothetical protein
MKAKQMRKQYKGLDEINLALASMGEVCGRQCHALNEQSIDNNAVVDTLGQVAVTLR